MNRDGLDSGFPDAEAFDKALAQLTPQERDEIVAMLLLESIPSELTFEPDIFPDFLFEPELIVEPEPAVEIEPALPATDRSQEVFEWIRALVTAVVIVGVFSLFITRVIGVSGDSMRPTLENGQRLLISNLFYRPQQGDIVIFADKSFYDASRNVEPLVKRVIAVAGQTVDIDFEVGEVSVDGVALSEPYVLEPTYLRGDLDFPFEVPPGCLFVMGDNRNDSLDSRFNQVGPVYERYVLGHVLLRVWPFNLFGRVNAI